MPISLTNAAQALQTTFHECADIAQEQSQVIRRNRKFSAQTLASTFVLGLLANPRASSDDLVLTAADLGIEVSSQAIDQRYTESMTTFFRELFTQMLGVVVRSQHSLAEIIERFTEVNLLDSSSIQLPDSMADEFRSRRDPIALRVNPTVIVGSGSVVTNHSTAGSTKEASNPASENAAAPARSFTLTGADLANHCLKLEGLPARSASK